MKIRFSEQTQLLLSLYIPSMIMSFGQGMVAPTIPILARSFDVSVGLAAQAVTAQQLGGTMMLIPSGVIIDRFGRRPAMIAGPVLVALASTITALTPIFPLFLVAQVMTGAGSNLWQTAREIAAVDVVRQEQRGRMLSGFAGMSSAGVAMGPVVGGVLTDLFNFRAGFWAYAAMALFTLAVSFRIPETRKERPPGPRRLLNIGRLSEVEPYFRVTFVIVIINTFVAMMRSSLINSMVPLYADAQMHLTPTQIGSVFSVYGLVNVLMIVPTGFLSDKMGRKAVVIPSTYIATVVFLLLPLAREVWHLTALGALAGVATGLALGTMATYTYDIIPAHARGRLQALRRVLGQSGSITGPAIGGLVADSFSPATVFWCFAPLQFVSGLLMTFGTRESLRRPPRDPS